MSKFGFVRGLIAQTGLIVTVATLLAVVACSPRDPVATSSKRLILDDAHGGSAGLYFLPPMVPSPVLQGTFAADLMPQVRIDELSGSNGSVLGTLATYTMVTGPGSETVRLESSQYVVNWHTNEFTLDAEHVYRIQVLLDGRVLGAADVHPVATGGQMKNVDTNLYVPLVDGRTLPIKFFLNRCAPVVCVATDQCHDAGVCDTATGVCSNPAKGDGVACTDGDACTLDDACQAGACVPGPAVVCHASDQCHDVGECNPTTGLCSDPAKGDGVACDDGSACTEMDFCEAGTCLGQAPISCVASDQCHDAGICDPATGACSDPAKPDGVPCADGDLCTLTDACQAGACLGGNPVVCAPSDQCHTAGACDPASGTCSNPAAPDGTQCNDGNGCTQNDFCALGTCVGSNPVVCAPDPTCETQGVCMPANGVCSPPSRCHVCGNGSVEYSEDCDDGNTSSGDGCTTSCKTEFCGDGIVSRTVRALRFRWLARSCDHSPVADIAFFLNDAEVARVSLADTCGCQPELQTVTVADPTLLALGSNGDNKLRVRTAGDVAWVAAQLDTPAGTVETMLWGTGGGTARPTCATFRRPASTTRSPRAWTAARSATTETRWTTMSARTPAGGRSATGWSVKPRTNAMTSGPATA